MKILSKFIENIKGFKTSVKRFPITMLYALATCITAIIFINNDLSNLNEYGLFNPLYLLQALIFGLIMSLAIGLFIETVEAGSRKKYLYLIYLIQAISVYFLYKYLLINQEAYSYNLLVKIRYFGIISLATISAYFLGKLFDSRNYDRYVIEIIKAGFIATINCIILVLGLYFIIFTINILFDIDIDYKVYGYIYVSIFSLVFTALTISRLPNKDHDYKNIELTEVAEKIFTYVLIPLIAIYTLIIYLFFIKVLFTKAWPNGIVSHLVLWYSLVGIFVLFFTKSIVDKSKLAAYFRRYYPASNIINLLLMFYAIYVRIDAYGFTVNRYIVLMAGIWVLLIDIFYILNKDEKNILVPMSMSFFIIISIFGPINMFRTSIKSQNKKLEELLVRNDLMEKGRLISSKEIIINYDDMNSIKSSIDYLDYGLGKNYNKVLNEKEVKDFNLYAKLDPNEKIEDEDWAYSYTEYVSYYANEKQANIDGYKYMLDLGSDTYGFCGSYNDSLISLDDDYILKVDNGNDERINLSDLLNEKVDLKNIETNGAETLDFTLGDFEIRLLIRNFSGQYDKRKEKSKVELNSLNVTLFIK